MPRPLALAAPVVSGVLLWASAPPAGIAWLAWCALVPAAVVALAAPDTRWGRASIPLAFAVFLELLLVPALPFGLARDQWGDPALPILVADSPVLAVALVAVPLFALALYAIRFPHPLPLASPASVPAALVVVAAPAVAWTALDLLRTKFDPGGFWGPLFLSQHDTAAARLAALAGPWLITFALVAANYALALAVVERGKRFALVPALAVVALTAPALALMGRDDARPTIRVAAVQPGYDTAEFDRPVLHYLRSATRDLERASLDLAGDLAPLTRDAVGRGARIVVWPEATIWVDPAENVRVRGALAALARETEAVLVVPYFLRSPAYGAAVAVLPDGSVTRAQPKQRPMWFLGEQGGNRAPPEPVDVGAARVGTLLGVDSQDPAAPRRLAAAGADVLAAATHDWGALAREQRALAGLHAAALRVAIVRADWRYGSAIVAPGGRLLADAGLEKRRVVLVADVPAPGGATAYERLGDAFGWVCLAALGALLVAGWRLRSGGQRAEAKRPAQALPESQLAAHPPP